MKDQTFGVEIEMNNIKRSTAAAVAAKFFGRPGTEYYIGGTYYTWACKDDQGREWKFCYDSSIDSWDSEKKCELVTPILKYDDIENLQELVRQLRHAGAKSDYTRGCGVHIHIGAQGQTATTLRHLTNMMASHEKLIIAAININRNRLNTYCQPVAPEFVRRVNQQKPKTMAELADVWYEANGATYRRNAHYNNSRYHILNLHATFTKGTIEFRCFQFEPPVNGHRSGLHAGKLKAWIQFCLAICDAAKKARSSRPDHVQCDNMKYAMTGWLARMELTGDEFKTMRKVFNEKLTGNAAVRYVA